MVDWCKMRENFHAQLQLCCVKLIFVVCHSWMVCCIVSIVAEYQSHLLYRIHCGGVSSLSWHFTTHYVCDSFIMCCMTHYDCQSLSNSSHVLCCPLGFCLSLIMLVTHCDCVSHLSCIRWLCATLVMYSLVVCHSHCELFDPFVIECLTHYVLYGPFWLCLSCHILCVCHVRHLLCDPLWLCVTLTMLYGPLIMTVLCIVWPIVTVSHSLTHCDCHAGHVYRSCVVWPIMVSYRSCVVWPIMVIIQVMCCMTHYGCYNVVLYNPLWLSCRSGVVWPIVTVSHSLLTYCDCDASHVLYDPLSLHLTHLYDP